MLSLEANPDISGSKVTALLDTSGNPTSAQCRTVILSLAYGEYRQCHNSCSYKKNGYCERLHCSANCELSVSPMLGDLGIPGERGKHRVQTKPSSHKHVTVRCITLTDLSLLSNE